MAETILQVKHLHKRFPPEHQGDEPGNSVLRDVNFEVFRSEIFAIVGPSGAGKSTLLRMLNGLEEPSAGEIHFSGKSLRDWQIPELRRRLAMLPQTPTMFPGTVLDNLMVPRRLRDGKHAQPDKEWFAELLSGVGLDNSFLPRQAGRLSIGQQQRIAFARALSLKPQVILLDEPTASLDPSAALTFLEKLSSFSHEQRLTVVLVTHQLEHARTIAERILLMIAGEVVCVQRTEDFFRAPATELARKFIAGELET